MQKKYWLLLIFVLIFVTNLTSNVNAFEPQRIISNSVDWRDVYSANLYSNFQGIQFNFLTSTSHSTILLYSIPAGTNVTVISSQRNPYVIGYKSILETKDLTVEEIEVRDGNLELAELLTDVKDFIVIDDVYGYNAVAVAPYAVLTKSYVLFANRENIGDIENLLDGRNPDSVLIYGNVDREVKDTLSKYNTETINYGDRFDNNIEIVKRYQEITHSKQVILTNGEFMEQEIMSGQEPVLFIGYSNVPEQIAEYVKQSEFQVAVLIGNELVNTATTVRRQIGISVFVKFAQGARTPKGSVAQVEDLDRFAVPRYRVNISIVSIKYNQATNQIEVTYRNNENLPAYVKSTLTLTYNNDSQTVGDIDAFFLDKSEVKTIIYSVDPIVADKIIGKVFTLYGESKKSLEFILRGDFEVEQVRVIDEAALEIIEVVYDSANGQFLIKVKNTGNVSAWATGELFDLIVNDEEMDISSVEPILLEPGQTKVIKVDVELSEKDIGDNPEVHVKVYYGQRKDALVKIIQEDFPMKIKSVDYVQIGLIGLIVILLGLFFLILLRKKKKCPDCKHKNPRRAKHCMKCGKTL